MLFRVLVAFSIACVAGAPLPSCAKTGAECTTSIACCNASSTNRGTDRCEQVNAFYSKCVSQPKCAKASAQCKGEGQSVMEATPCCDTGFVCNATNKWYSSCVNASAPAPSPPGPAPPQPTCAATGGQCGGSGFKSLSCCATESQCEVVNDFFSKCVDQPKCVKEDQTCSGTGDHPMKSTACCDAVDTCVPWGVEWNVCRSKGHETCSVVGEQCAGTGASSMKEKACCDKTNTCTEVNEYYSKCEAKPSLSFAIFDKPSGLCPGLTTCPSGAAPSGKYAGTREIMGSTTRASVTIIDSSKMNIVISGGSSKLDHVCNGEAYAYDGNAKLTLTNVHKPGDCAHEQGTEYGTVINAIEYDAATEQIVVTVTIQTTLTTKMTLFRAKDLPAAYAA